MCGVFLLACLLALIWTLKFSVIALYVLFISAAIIRQPVESCVSNFGFGNVEVAKTKGIRKRKKIIQFQFNFNVQFQYINNILV
jgi:hypothetical protein